MWERRYQAFLIKAGWTFGGFFIGSILIYIIGLFLKKRVMKFMKKTTKMKKKL
jgi:membrane protein DedA with SNARE-associated domain